MVLQNGFIINAPAYLLPSYRISPFRTADICKNKNIEKANSTDPYKYLLGRFLGKKALITDNGRSALGTSLAMLELKSDDVVTIFTTTNKFYISGCVTSEIEKFCQWSREIEDNTKVILVNHEFGFSSQKMKEYASLGFPIIEDFAHSFISDSKNGDAGYYADFLIFSFSKYFPIQIGGALLYDQKYQNPYAKKEITNSYVTNVISNYIESISSIKLKRLKNYNYYTKLFSKLKLTPYFKIYENDCPGVFCFEVPKKIDLVEMKIFINSNGIESSIFYGENAYFLPCHQNLEECDIEYIYNVVKCFLEVNL